MTCLSLEVCYGGGRVDGQLMKWPPASAWVSSPLSKVLFFCCQNSFSDFGGRSQKQVLVSHPTHCYHAGTACLARVQFFARVALTLCSGCSGASPKLHPAAGAEGCHGCLHCGVPEGILLSAVLPLYCLHAQLTHAAAVRLRPSVASVPLASASQLFRLCKPRAVSLIFFSRPFPLYFLLQRTFCGPSNSTTECWGLI